MKPVFKPFLFLLLLPALGTSGTILAQNTPWPATGSVGIGTLSPGADLTVNGRTHIVSNLTIGADVDGPPFFGLYFPNGGNIGFNLPSQPADQRIWDIIAVGSTFRILTQNDAFNAIQEPLIIQRGTGINIASVAFPVGNVLIGKKTQTNTSYILDVNGNARVNKVIVNATGADYVFDPGYRLPSLQKLEQYIQGNHHLPDIAPADEMRLQGLDVGDNQTALLKKIEELTLYLIEQNKKLEKLQKEVNTLKRAGTK